MELFNIRHKSIPADAVNIMRPSDWGNPFNEKEYGRDDCIALYEHWLFMNPSLVARMRVELRGKDLACCCWPKPCHGNVILRVVNGEEPQPLPEGHQALAKLSAKQEPDRLADLLDRFNALGGDYSENKDSLAIPLFFHAMVKALPALRRLTATRQEQWPKPATETVAVAKADLLTWREEWLEANDPQDGTDCVAPHDKYLYGSKP